MFFWGVGHLCFCVFLPFSGHYACCLWRVVCFLCDLRFISCCRFFTVALKGVVDWSHHDVGFLIFAFYLVRIALHGLQRPFEQTERQPKESSEYEEALLVLSYLW